MGSKPDFRRRVGARIRALRVARGLSQNDLARLLPGSVSSSQVSRWERGRQLPNVEHVQALARAFRVSEEEVLCGER